MPLALTAKISVNPERLRKDAGTHELAHEFLIARLRAMKRDASPFALAPALG